LQRLADERVRAEVAVKDAVERAAAEVAVMRSMVKWPCIFSFYYLFHFITFL